MPKKSKNKRRNNSFSIRQASSSYLSTSGSYRSEGRWETKRKGLFASLSPSMWLWTKVGHRVYSYAEFSQNELNPALKQRPIPLSWFSILQSWNLCVCACECAHICRGLHAYTLVHACGGQRLIVRCFLLLPFTLFLFFLDTGSLTEHGTIWFRDTSQPATPPHMYLSLLPQHHSCWCMAPEPGFPVASGESHADLHACRACTLLTESHHPWQQCLHFFEENADTRFLQCGNSTLGKH